MQNLILQPAGSKASEEHFNKTIKNGFELNKIKKYLSEKDTINLLDIFQNNKLECS